MGIDNRLAQTQPQPQPSAAVRASLPCGIKHIKQVRLSLMGNTRSIVRNLHTYPILLLPGRQYNIGPHRSILNGVVHNVYDDLHNQPDIHFRHQQIIRQIHEQLIGSLEQRCSIDALSRQYLMNPTTLKNAFKEMYGTSIAAHIREHRMEYAAQLLQSTCLSVADISRRVGYDSQSRFSTAFKRHFGLLPTEYRKNRMRDPCTGKKTAGE